MKPKTMFLTGLMLMALYAGSNPFAEQAYARQPGDRPSPSSEARPAGTESGKEAPDPFLRALGAKSDEEVREALYQGKSLADIAAANRRSLQPILDLQLAQLSGQLERRYEEGGIREADYRQLLAELPDMVAKSVRGSAGSA